MISGIPVTGRPPSTRNRAQASASSKISSSASKPISGGIPNPVTQPQRNSTPSTSPQVALLFQDSASLSARRADHRLNAPINNNPPRA